MSDYNGLCFSYKIDQLVKRRTALDLSFLYSEVSGKIDSSLLVGQFSLRVLVRATRNPEIMYVPPNRVMASLFARLPRAFNAFLHSYPPFDIFYDSHFKSTMLHLYYSISYNVSLGCVERVYL